MFEFLLFWKRRDFGKSFGKAKAVFNKSLRKAEKILAKIDKEGNKNDEKIAEPRERNNVLADVRTETSQFIKSLNKLLQ